MIDPQTVAKIMDAARIEEVVSDYVTLRKRGVNLLGLCPFHDEKTGSFTVSPVKGIFKCFGCGKGGNSVHFIMEHEQVSYVEALKLLAKKYHIEVQERELSSAEKAAQNDRESMFVLNEFAQKYFTKILTENTDGRTIGLSYFRERGFRDDIIKKFQLGYCLDQWDALSKAALAAGYKQSYLEKTGLAFANDRGKLTDRFRGRVMFPVHTLSGKVIAFGGRVLKTADKTAKYVNSPESEIYHKSNELYGIYFAKNAIKKQDCCYLVEGYTDVISMHQAGIENVVASSGTALTPGQIRLIHRFTENVTIIYDGDKAGIKAALRGIDLFLEEGLNIKVLLLPDGEDPDSFAQKHNASDFIAYVQQNQSDFMRFKTQLLLQEAGKDPIKRAKLIQDIVDSIAIIPSQIIRQVYVRDCSSLLDIDEKILLNAIAKIKTDKHEQELLKKRQEEHKLGTTNTTAVQTNTDSKKIESPSAEAEPAQGAFLTSGIKYEKETKNLIQVLVRYGDKPLYTQPETNEIITVGQFIIEDLERDQIEFESPLYVRIIEEFKSHQSDEGFNAENFFKFHQDTEISILAVNLLTEKYALSKVHFKQSISENVQKDVRIPTDEDRLTDLVPRLIFELKNSLIKDQMKQKLQEMKYASEVKDDKKIMELMGVLSNLDHILKQLSRTLGDRVVIKL